MSGILGGAAGNAIYGGIVHPPRNRKGGDGNPLPTDARASALPDPHLPVETGSGDGDPDDQDSWPGARPAYRRDRLADTKPPQATTDPAGEYISRRTCGAGSRSALIVLQTAGNRDHWNPSEGSGASHG